MPTILEPTVIYDGGCGFCRQSIDALRRLLRREFVAIPYQSPEARLLVPGLSESELAAQVWLLVGERRFGGGEAVVRMLTLDPWWWAVAWAYYLPGVRQLVDAGYRLVAANRHRLSRACGWSPEGGRDNP